MPRGSSPAPGAPPVRRRGARRGRRGRRAGRPRAALVGRGDDEVDRLADRPDALRLLVGDLDPEALLEIHDQLDEVEGVRLQVVAEVGLHRDVVLVDVEALHEDLLDLIEHLIAVGHARSFRTPWRAGRKVAEHYHEGQTRSEEHTSELQSRQYLVCRLLLEKKKT